MYFYKIKFYFRTYEIKMFKIRFVYIFTFIIVFLKENIKVTTTNNFLSERECMKRARIYMYFFNILLLKSSHIILFGFVHIITFCFSSSLLLSQKIKSNILYKL